MCMKVEYIGIALEAGKEMNPSKPLLFGPEKGYFGILRDDPMAVIWLFFGYEPVWVVKGG